MLLWNPRDDGQLYGCSTDRLRRFERTLIKRRQGPRFNLSPARPTDDSFTPRLRSVGAQAPARAISWNGKEMEIGINLSTRVRNDADISFFFFWRYIPSGYRRRQLLRWLARRKRISPENSDRGRERLWCIFVAGWTNLSAFCQITGHEFYYLRWSLDASCFGAWSLFFQKNLQIDLDSVV